MYRSLSAGLLLWLWLWAPALQAEAVGFAIRGIELGQSRDVARARLRADNAYHQTLRDAAHPELERDVASSLWNLEACVPSRGTVTRAACTRSDLRYSHPKLGARVMAIDFTQTLKPTVPAALIRERLVAAYGAPSARDQLSRGLFNTRYGRTLTWEGDGGRRLQATLYFYDGEESRTIALTLKAEDPDLMTENQALLDAIDAGGEASGEGQLTF